LSGGVGGADWGEFVTPSCAEGVSLLPTGRKCFEFLSKTAGFYAFLLPKLLMTRNRDQRGVLNRPPSGAEDIKCTGRLKI